MSHDYRTNYPANHRSLARVFAKINSIQRQAKAKLAKRNNQDSENDALARYTLGLFVATCVIAGAAVLTFVAALLQWDALKKTDQAAHDLATSAVEQVKAAQDQVKVIQGQLDEMRLIRQPFVYFQNIKFETDPNSTAQRVGLFAYPQWKNAGNGPTYRLRLIVFCNGTGPSDFNYRQNGTLPRILGPQQVDAGGRCEMTVTQIPEIAGTIGTMWIGGKATYFDDLENTRVRITEFCQSAAIVRVPNPTGFTIRAGMDGSQFCESSPSRNCADTDCPAEDRQ